MATSLDDLTTALVLSARAGTDRDDAAAALGWAARVVGTLRQEGALLLADRPRDLSAARLQDACDYAAMSFNGRDGRVADLTAVVHDLAARLRDQLSAEDRWVTIVCIAMAARYCARSIATAGPYRSVPELAVVAEGAREILALAALRPTRPERLCALDLPIPCTTPPDGAAVGTAAAELTGELCRRGREPLTMREITIACHAAYQFAAYTAIASRAMGPERAHRAYEAAHCWNTIRETAALYRDAVPRHAGTGIIDRAVTLDTAVRHSLSDTHTATISDDDLRWNSAYLARTARACHAEIVRLGPALLVPHGPKPISEARVSEWLHHVSFPVTAPDLRPLLNTLAEAQIQTVARHRLRVEDRSSSITPHGLDRPHLRRLSSRDPVGIAM